ncbi:hypothetical protein Pan153_36910 [Gimesia panareensis]|uniref:DUF2079 domain-containing protein n=1 Tax=Gimesia panareensis TaxID=2527978 RepID=A0A518FRQ4_9PLAN|nr:DUF2079 domain-containing protein [Gimesia panareensis]QDV19029.1 hypothetical protein Pan153_36910 [Gimesia panareensis]
MNQSPSPSPAFDSRRFTYAVLCVLLGPGAVTLALQTIFSSQDLATMYVSVPLWESLLTSWAGTLDPATQTVSIPFFPLMGYLLLTAALTWLGGSFLLSRFQKHGFASALTDWGCLGFRWWFLPGVWELLRITLFLVGWESGVGLLLATSPFWFAVMLAGWLATLVTLLFPVPENEPAPAELPVDLSANQKTRIPVSAWLMIGVFALVFTTMNWRLYQGLLIPHGDSAMYEEHLWNVLHGKGFRSYLDQGLFWGEHIQFIHLLLSPLYFIWPSHLLLELSETVALASGAIPLYRMASRHSGSKTAGKAMVAAYLCYFPLQFLDIAIDLKTFRPISFGVPLMLFALDALERKRWKSATVLLLLCLAAKEDYAIILGPLGLWIAWRAFQERKQQQQDKQPALLKTVAPGIGLSVFAVVYLALVVKVLIPWFRSGTQVHYVGYFQKFGNSLGEVVSNILFNPGLLLGELFQPDTLIYALALLVPLGLLPLFSPGRLLVGLPIFGLLCLNELAHDPRHHFHAPIVPIVCWAAAYGIGNVPVLLQRWKKQTASLSQAQTWATHFLWCSSLATGLFFSLGPAGLVFWDSGSSWYWGRLYVPGERARQFEKIANLIPPDSRVASTDFVHPRYTHHERSYDYSNYRRKVNEYEAGVPEDTDYIVIDTQHPYSEIKTPDQIPEYHDHPEQWELLPDETDGYFIVLKRKHVGKSAANKGTPESQK